MNFLSTLLLISVTASAQSIESEHIHKNNITKIAFGSCYKYSSKDSKTFSGIEKSKADLCLMIGDNIYADTADMKVMKKKYQELASVPEFEKLRESIPILATWDDHDYGGNNKGKTYIKKKESAEIFKDFFNVPKDSIMRTREGVYSSHTFPSDGKMIQIIILDTRYFRDELLINKKIKRDTVIKGVQPHLDPKKTMLGDIQWAWFEKQLEVKANLRIIASSTQIISHEKGMENWGLFPLQRTKLYNLLKKANVKNTFAISGDVHYS